MPILIFSVALVALLIACWWRLRSAYRLSLTSVDEKRAGLIRYYRYTLRQLFPELFRGNLHLPGLCALFHLIGVHLLVPAIGFSFWLDSDANFLVVVIAIITSIQITQRLFPGVESDSEAEATES